MADVKERLAFEHVYGDPEQIVEARGYERAIKDVAAWFRQDDLGRWHDNDLRHGLNLFKRRWLAQALECGVAKGCAGD